jgi:TRAP-type uncharacterized transport system substrate-binding protein
MQDGTDKVSEIQVLMPIGTEEIHLVVKSKGTINSFANLDNPNVKVAIGSTNTGTYLTAKMIKKLTKGKWIEKEVGFKTAIKLLLDNKIDAFFFVGATPIEKFKIFSRLAPHIKKSIKLVPIEDERLNKYYSKISIKKGSYRWANYEVKTYAVKSVLATTIRGETNSQREQLVQILTDIKKNIDRYGCREKHNWKLSEFERIISRKSCFFAI